MARARLLFKDAGFDNAVFWTTVGITANNGQVCAAGSRIYVHESIYDAFLLAFAEKLVGTTHGDPLLPETTKGPVISFNQKQKISQYVSHAKESGLRLLVGGEDLSKSGNFVPSTAFADVLEDSKMMLEEIFGPVAVSSLWDFYLCEAYRDFSPSPSLKQRPRSSKRLIVLSMG